MRMQQLRSRRGSFPIYEQSHAMQCNAGGLDKARDERYRRMKVWSSKPKYCGPRNCSCKAGEKKDGADLEQLARDRGGDGS